MSTEAPPAPPPVSKKPAPPPPSKLPPASNGAPSIPAGNRSFSVSSGKKEGPLKVCLYGTGGIGKTELASNLTQLGKRVLFFDIEQGSSALDVQRVDGIESLDDLRAALHSEQLCSQFDTLVIDSITKAEELAVAWTLANVKTEKGESVSRLEHYGWGKGYVHLYETFLMLLGDLDAQVRRGRDVILIAHECVAKAPNPAGDDWPRYEPRLQNADKCNIRAKVKEWVDHLLYVGYDVNVHEKTGKGQGSGTRTIFPVEMPTHWAKSRTLSRQVIYTKDSADLWSQLLERSE